MFWKRKRRLLVAEFEERLKEETDKLKKEVTVQKVLEDPKLQRMLAQLVAKEVVEKTERISKNLKTTNDELAMLIEKIKEHKDVIRKNSSRIVNAIEGFLAKGRNHVDGFMDSIKQILTSIPESDETSITEAVMKEPGDQD